MICWHRWGEWEIEDAGQVFRKRRDGEEVMIGRFVIQKRRCRKCGKYQMDSQRAPA